MSLLICVFSDNSIARLDKKTLMYFSFFLSISHRDTPYYKAASNKVCEDYIDMIDFGACKAALWTTKLLTFLSNPSLTN